MNEKIIKKRITRMIIWVLILTIALGSSVFIIFNTLKKVQTDVNSTKITKRMEEYQKSLERQFESDFQILNTVTPFLGELSQYGTEQWLENLEKANKNNQFIKMAYYTSDKKGVEVDISKEGSQEVDWNSLEQPLQHIIEQAFHENRAISEVYQDEESKEERIGYAVPIYKNRVVVGVLVGINDMNVYENLLQKEKNTVGDFDVYMFDQHGNMLIYPAVENKEEIQYSKLADEEKQKIEAFVAKEKIGSINIKIHNKTYPVYLQAVGVNGWYILYIDSGLEESSSIKTLSIVTGVVVISTLVLYLVFIFLGYRVFLGSIRSLIQVAYYDRLTGSYNIDKFYQEVKELLEKDDNYSLAIINIRRFRHMNDVLGMKKADEILCQVKRILESSIKEKEIFCRHNADLFYILLRESEKEVIKQRMIEIQNNISEISNHIDKNYKITTCVGISVQRKEEYGEKWMAELIHQAEFALKQVDFAHNNQLIFYSNKMYQIDYEQGIIENDMETSLKNGEFRLFLQPKITLKDGTIMGAESLVRWIREDGSMIYPDIFIPAFEKNGFCIELDLYMVEQTCKKLREWMDQGYEPIQLSVNQSKLLFYQSDYIEKLCAIREKYKIPDNFITLEILEGLAADNVDELNQIIKELKEKGFQISMDDFGAGYSSLNVLGSLDIDELKLDRQFLMPTSFMEKENQRAVMKHIVQLAKELSIRIVVEGVETKEDKDFIKSIGCDIGQGYYYSRPIPVEEFEQQFVKKEVVFEV